MSQLQQSRIGSYQVSSKSSKKYFVKRQKIPYQTSKQKKTFFTNIMTNQQLQSSLLMHNLSISSIDNIQPTFNKTQINPKDYQTLKSQHSQILPVKDSRISFNEKNLIFQKNSKTLEQTPTGPYKKILNKKIIFETICDKNYNKSLKRRQILIEGSQNPEHSINGFILPQITSNPQKLRRQRSFQESNICQTQQMLSNKSDLFHNSSTLRDRSVNLQKLNIDRFKKYRQEWKKTSNKRLELSSNRAIKFNKSLLDKSFVKSCSLAKQYNNELIVRKSFEKFQQKLRGEQKIYHPIGQVALNISPLKGKSLNNFQQSHILLNSFSNNLPAKHCEQVYKVSKSESRQQPQRNYSTII